MDKKNIKNSKKAVENRQYSPSEAIDLLKKVKYVKFDPMVTTAINLNIDPKQSSQSVRGMVYLPEGVGKPVRIVVICSENDKQKAIDAGAVEAGDIVVENVKSGNINFDVCIAVPSMMGKVGQISRILGPKGLMPNPKLGTVTNDFLGAIEKAKKGQAEFKSDKYGILHIPLGKLSFSTDKIIKNFHSVLDAVNAAKPKDVKGKYLKSSFLSATMSPGVKINISDIC
jgi:large subunit ribosomal protein L1